MRGAGRSIGETRGPKVEEKEGESKGGQSKEGLESCSRKRYFFTSWHLGNGPAAKLLRNQLR